MRENVCSKEGPYIDEVSPTTLCGGRDLRQGGRILLCIMELILQVGRVWECTGYSGDEKEHHKVNIMNFVIENDTKLVNKVFK